MCGDWVYCFDPEEPEDRQINKVSAVRVEYNEGAIKFEQFTDWFEEGWFEPIPLTPEILEKNGFYDRNTQWYYKRFWSNGCFDIAVALNYREIEVSKVCGAGTDCEEVDYGSTIAFGSDIYVHELQHALRLCGLNELADGFIV